MKLIRATKGTFFFELARREKGLLLALLQLYPRVPSAHHRLSQATQTPDHEANQRLLDEALAEQRAENQRQLRAWLADPRRWTEEESGWRLSLARGDVEWLLQVLNDIRIGSWLLLGSPEPRLEVLNAQTAPHLWAMELAGHFQTFLLGVLEGGGGET